MNRSMILLGNVLVVLGVIALGLAALDQVQSSQRPGSPVYFTAYPPATDPQTSLARLMTVPPPAAAAPEADEAPSAEHAAPEVPLELAMLEVAHELTVPEASPERAVPEASFALATPEPSLALAMPAAPVERVMPEAPLTLAMPEHNALSEAGEETAFEIALADEPEWGMAWLVASLAEHEDPVVAAAPPPAALDWSAESAVDPDPAALTAQDAPPAAEITVASAETAADTRAEEPSINDRTRRPPQRSSDVPSWRRVFADDMAPER
jgi:hypothetical protein